MRSVSGSAGRGPRYARATAEQTRLATAALRLTTAGVRRVRVRRYAPRVLDELLTYERMGRLRVPLRRWRHSLGLLALFLGVCTLRAAAAVRALGNGSGPAQAVVQF